MSTLSDPQRFARLAIGGSMIGSALLLLGSSLASPAIKSDEAAQIAVIAQHPARYYLFTILILLSTMLLVPALIGLMQMTAERCPRLSNIGGALSVFGALVGVGDATSQLIIWQMGARGADRAQMAALLHRFDDVTGSSLLFSIGGIAVLVGVLLLSIALWRSQAAPAWAAACVFAGALLNIVGFSAQSVGILIISSLVLLAGLGWIGWQLLTSDSSVRARYAVAPSSP